VLRLFFRSFSLIRDNGKAKILILTALSISLFGVLIAYELNSWYRDFYDMLQLYDTAALFPLIILFLGLVFSQTTAVGINLLLVEYTEAVIREKLMQTLLAKLIKQTGVTDFKRIPADQRIAEDTDIYATRVVSLTSVLTGELIKAGVFFAVIVSTTLQTSYVIMGFVIPIGILLGVISVGYFFISWGVISLGGKQLMDRETNKRNIEAILREQMLRIRDSFQVPDRQSERDVRQKNSLRIMADLTTSTVSVAKVASMVSFSNALSTSLAGIIPLGVLAPAYLSKEITLGELVQISAAFGILQLSLSQILNSYREITRMLSAYDRICTFIQILEGTSKSPSSSLS